MSVKSTEIKDNTRDCMRVLITHPDARGEYPIIIGSCGEDSPCPYITL